ncbi:MAG TPA: hypothetical protein VF816_17365 [Rhodocyclaceae bacterium]
MCCGQRRNQLRAVAALHRSLLPLEPSASHSSHVVVWFEYFGRTGMTVRGSASGKDYRFERPGFRVAVDSRDAPAFAGIPNLRQVARG